MASKLARSFSVDRWNKKVLQAAQIKCGACTEAAGLVGIDLVAQDGNTFAHAHFDISTAIQFQNDLAEAIAFARNKLS